MTPNTPIIHSLLRSSVSTDSSLDLVVCTATDDQNYSFEVNITNTGQLAFIISLPYNYTLNSITHPTIIINVQCNIDNNTSINQVN